MSNHMLLWVEGACGGGRVEDGRVNGAVAVGSDGGVEGVVRLEGYGGSGGIDGTVVEDLLESEIMCVIDRAGFNR